MRCKSCDALMSKAEANDILYINDDGSIVYNDWCFDCTQKYGSEEALAILDTQWFQCGDVTEDCELYHIPEKE